MKKTLIPLILFVLLTNILQCQQAGIMFYNVENLFDTRDDIMTNDDEFLPDSARYWTYERFWKKIVRIYKVISAAEAWDMPAVVGLCEIENRDVLEKLIYDTPLEKYGYRIIHQDSRDPRGIDVGLIYRPELFTPDTSVWLKVELDGKSTTRDILLVSGRLWDVPLSIYVNHWPSRSGGTMHSNPRRLRAASSLMHSIDSLRQADPVVNIIIMGDFNDEPGNESIQMLTGGSYGTELSIPYSDRILNLSGNIGRGNGIGTIKYQGVWSEFDQFLVSGSIYYGMNGLSLSDRECRIFAPSFLLETDPGYYGSRPFRTYLGPNYHDGYSDHLPVCISVVKI